MNPQNISFFLAASLACALLTFDSQAQRHGWPTGALFRSQKAGLIGIACGFVLLCAALYGIFFGAGWSVLLWLVVGWLAGGPLVLLALGRLSGLIALIAAPVLTVVCLAL